MNDPKVREAFMYSIDRQSVIDAIIKLNNPNAAVLNCGFVSFPNIGNWCQTKPFQQFTYDPAKAKKLLADAGHPDGIEVELHCKKDPDWEPQACQAMVEQWAEAGIKVKLNVMPGAQYWDVWTKVPFGFTNWTHRPLAIMVLGLAYRTGVPWNESDYSNPKFDELLTKAEGIIDLEERKKVVKELEVIMQEDGPIVQPLWRAIYQPFHKKVKGLNAHPTEYYFLEQVWLEA
jgi:peptide/nickel transport system substrate-binding protein